MFYASLPKERLKGITHKFCPIVRPHALNLAIQGTFSQELFCRLYSIAFIFEKINKYGPREIISESNAILKTFFRHWSNGPAKSVCTISKGFVALASGLLFLLFTSFLLCTCYN